MSSDASPAQFNILYAEDNAVIATAFRRVMEQEGFQVDHCPDGESALRRIQEKAYDIVVLDLMMPKMDGVSFVNQAQAILWKTKVPVIIFSQVDLPLVREELRKLGVTEYVNKDETTPFKLIDAIKALLASKSKQQAPMLRMAPPAKVEDRRISTLAPDEFHMPERLKEEPKPSIIGRLFRK